MVCLQSVVGPLLVAALAAEAVPLAVSSRPARLDDRSLFGAVAEDGAKFLGKDASKAAPAIAKDATKAAPAIAKGATKAAPKAAPAAAKAVPAAAKAAPAAVKAAPAAKPAPPAAPKAAPASAAGGAKTDAEDAAACLLRARGDDAAKAACTSKKAAKAAKPKGKPTPEEIAAAKAAKAAKSPEQLAAEKQQAAEAKAAAAAKSKADSEAKAAQHNAKANSKSSLVKAISNKNDIPASTKCGSAAGVNNHDQAAVVAAQTRGVQLLQSKLDVAAFPHPFTVDKGAGIDKVNVPAACQGKPLFEFPILASGDVFDVGNKDPGTDRVLFTNDAAGNNLNCGLITHDTKAKVKNANGDLVQRFVSCT